jgi:transposase
MQRLQAFKYELRPNGEQKRQMGRFAGSRRFVYNRALALQKAHYEAGGTFIGYVAMAKLLTAENRPTQTHFRCVECGYENHADVVGAMNVLARGHRVAACGEEGSGLGRKTRTKPTSVKQEPTEVTMDELMHSTVGIARLSGGGGCQSKYARRSQLKERGAQRR